MRDKFRGLSKADGTPVEGYLVRHHDSGAVYVLPKIEYISHEHQATAIGGFVEVQPGSVVACTGLEDSAGVSICEDDILTVFGEDGTPAFRFKVAFGPCGGVKNVEHPVGYVGYYLQPADDATAQYMEFGLRMDILCWLNAYRCVVSGNVLQRKGKE